MTSHRSRTSDARAAKPLEFVHIDLAGPVDPSSKDGFRYALICMDDFSGLSNLYFLKNKSDAATAFKKFLADTSPYGRVKRVISDQGGEFVSSEFSSLLVENKIKHEKSAPFSPHQNGTAERAWRTLFDMARCLLLQSGLPKTIWPYAVMAASYIRNRCINKRLGIIPFEAVTNKKPNMKNMQQFEKPGYAFVQNPKQLNDRSEKGCFVRFDRDSPAHLVYFPDSEAVKKVRIVKFLEDDIL
ncbi:transposon Ty2-C Gag-Pol polyprotein [Elysia marginata]|uniref:Transposon Ty2-C Gag-Pol polyprotein n=1 Tax=Elysia marginata TaxID=1093978 RepID=A0AAV4F3W6_9GAST|nr:transposon Ty2-C Gag-Pol polyprotein [Elysia marginata]